MGPYQIVSLIGAGGMGQVYRAQDTRLARTVAIKTLSAEIDSSAAREQFDREARAISSLSGPNICTLYDVGTQDDRAYLVMEYLEGETLAERLSCGPLPFKKVLEYAIQIADGVAGEAENKYWRLDVAANEPALGRLLRAIGRWVVGG